MMVILIKKGKAPKSLVEFSNKAYAYYGGMTKETKDELRTHLLREQGYLCAYCMKRIEDNRSKTKIEHWYPETRLSDKGCLEYNNMLICCTGHNDGDTGNNDTCDTSKKETVITIDPRREEHIAAIKYRSRNGEIYSDEPEFQKDINETLNLNSEAHSLKANRKCVLDTVKKYIDNACKNGKVWKAKDTKKLIAKYERCDGEGKREPYAGIALWYLRKKLPKNI